MDEDQTQMLRATIHATGGRRSFLRWLGQQSRPKTSGGKMIANAAGIAFIENFLARPPKPRHKDPARHIQVDS